MGDTQEQQFKSKEREIPVFTVLKNNGILKNIYLLDDTSSISHCSSSIDKNGDRDPETEETLVVGRHPGCSIKLEHPSISRFHLRINLKPYSRCLFVTDLSSVHGTWVSGKRIEAGVLMKLSEGETLQLGGSSRLYKLNWIPLSRAYDIDNPFVPQLDDADTAEDDAEGETFQDENILSCKSDQTQILSDNIKGLELLNSDENLAFSTEKKRSPSGSFMPENSCNSYSNDEKMDTREIYIQEHEISSIQPCEFDKEHYASRVLCSSVVSQTQSEIKNPKTPGTKSVKRSSCSIWSRRDKGKSVQIETGRHIEESSAGTSDSSHVKSLVDENCHPESVLNDTFVVPGHEEEKVFTPDKAANHSPFSLVLGSWKGRATKNRESILKIRPMHNNSSHVTSLIYENYHAQTVSKDDSTFADHEDKETFTPDKENHTSFSLVVGSWMSKGEKNRLSVLKTPSSSVEDHVEDIFTPDKENMSPNDRCLRFTKKMEILEVKNPTSSHRSSPLSKSVNCKLHLEVGNLSTPDIESQPRKVIPTHELESFASKSHANLKKKMCILKSRGDRNPFQPLSLKSSCNSSGNSKPSTHEVTRGGGGCTNKSEEAFLLPKKSTVEEKKRWTIIVDTATLLNENSRKELQLLRGLNGTHLIIPRIAMRELDSMLKCGGFYRRAGKASAALQWIEDCMENTEWWIHVQSYVEEGTLIPPAPPHASSPHWYTEDENAVSVGSIPFSTYSFVTPTTEDRILESALFFKQFENNEGLVLLSDDVTLKIKAMAEGVICETAEEFRRSLVNPFSKRFLYTESSPRGPTWSVVDDVILKERYYPSPSKKLSKFGGNGVKGLKLILLHNSNFSKTVPVL